MNSPKSRHYRTIVNMLAFLPDFSALPLDSDGLSVYNNSIDYYYREWMLMVDRLRDQLADAGLRMTRPREAIYRLLKSSMCHPDATWVYERVREEIPHLSLGTVYRALGVLVDAGLVSELRCSDGRQVRYDGNLNDHSHIVCRGCGSLCDIGPLPALEERERIEEQSGYLVEECRLHYVGLCPRCQAVPEGEQFDLA
jgi:Fur family transcriptional regulator, peroxide stress response regulator